ncbi:N-6 DNA Methylase [Mucilaginibacter gossypiicola]|uniref:site-specific DNA-methyltransferase (adenine-specific) n=1 Tax=Mucilaginibacter gossypiicola TaxID=551995 RepID=A0A1H8M208_9SPHI|nr:N-6 DNA methylase [Mucilaginibacter gossypiicola]SEO11349.1 N-6 DNA Methylase [Mucilaginibacter gossypiicola]
MKQFNPLLTEFERFAYGQSLHSAFVELLDWALLPFRKWDDADSQNIALEKYRTHPKVQQLITLVTLIGDLSEGFNDPLGELYMQAISNGFNGQYFSPTPVCNMMAAISVGDDSVPGQTVCDCACGSGRMLLAAAKINRHLHLYGADLDITCCKMALLNMLFNSLTGEIAHMNSLSNDFYTGYRVDTVLVDGYHYPYYVEFNEPGQSRIWLHDLKGTEVKSKFDKPFEPVRSLQPINGTQGTLF